MANTQNVTLSIPKDILRKAKILAVQKGTSLSGLLTQSLAELVAHQEAFDQARQHSLAELKRGFDLSAGLKHAIAQQLVEQCWENENGCLHTKDRVGAAGGVQLLPQPGFTRQNGPHRG